MAYKYFKHVGYKGKRYFRMNSDAAFPVSEMVMQVCLSAGPPRRGRANCIGVYVIRKLTLLQNYGFSDTLKPATKKEYDTAFKRVIKMMQ